MKIKQQHQHWQNKEIQIGKVYNFFCKTWRLLPIGTTVIPFKVKPVLLPGSTPWDKNRLIESLEVSILYCTPTNSVPQTLTVNFLTQESWFDHLEPIEWVIIRNERLTSSRLIL